MPLKQKLFSFYLTNAFAYATISIGKIPYQERFTFSALKCRSGVRLRKPSNRFAWAFFAKNGANSYGTARAV